MLDETINDSCKVVLVGETGVGKTSIISQFMDQSFEPNFNSTTGAIYSATKIKIGDKEAKLEIWDTAGQEKYRALTKMFYKDTSIAVIVYDITKPKSFTELKNYWVKEMQGNTSNNNIIKFIAANKCDLYENEEVDETEARKYSESIGAFYKRISAKNAEGIENLFIEIGKQFLSQEWNQSSESYNINSEIKLNKEINKSKNTNKKICC